MCARDLPRPGQRFMGFTLVRVLGRGRMGAVFEATGRSGRRVALEILQPTGEDRETQLRRMLDEGVVMVGIKHPNFVEVYDHGEHEGLVWRLMELLEGETLRARLLREGPLSLQRACATLRAASYAVEQCHVLDIVHGDVKPESFFITREGQVKLLDLGIAHRQKSALAQETIGSPAYMAPELFTPRLGGSPESDVYALGLMAFEMLAGFHPFLRDDAGHERSARALCFEHAFTETPRLDALGVPSPIAEVVARATEKDPRARHPSGGALAAAIWTAWKQVRANIRPRQASFGSDVGVPRPRSEQPVRRLPEVARRPAQRGEMGAPCGDGGRRKERPALSASACAWGTQPSFPAHLSLPDPLEETPLVGVGDDAPPAPSRRSPGPASPASLPDVLVEPTRSAAWMRLLPVYVVGMGVGVLLFALFFGAVRWGAAFFSEVEKTFPSAASERQLLTPTTVSRGRPLVPPGDALVQALMPPESALAQRITPPVTALAQSLTKPVTSLAQALTPPVMALAQALLPPVTALVQALMPPESSPGKALVPPTQRSPASAASTAPTTDPFNQSLP
ncbi:serine/threonine-protein kinase [Chondromyces crocatus]|uniref:Protein kinase domain-containing protein n=1 Tax=Chondromyces crocatus TaxID=52 RepID=A0A0K1E8P7_CHOCO|nr:serine/threonine-protein kinase [Chondromyces crocatus]AKT37251.1 uncharacterized protein CMC5_013820 [Chondromyces crocatus]